MTELVIATGNRGKLAEIRDILRSEVHRIYSLADFPDLLPVVEDGASFRENAIKKARQIAEILNRPVLADDSGLEVAALNGEPGIFTARFAGEGATDAENNEKLLRSLSGVPVGERSALFRCVIALCIPGDEVRTFEGTLHGEIGFALRGSGGFGYDPLFQLPAYGVTLAELSPELKNSISHRAQAMEKVLLYLRAV